MSRAVSALSAVVLAVASAGCGTLSAPPRDRFYRLDPELMAAAPAAGVDERQGTVIYVAPFTASGLHAERALVYVHEDDTTLERYNYHFWIDSPRFMLQRQLAGALRERLGLQVVDEPHPGAAELRGRIVRFERRAGAGAGEALVSVRVEAYRSGSRVPALSRDYHAAAALEQDSVEAFVAAMNDATAAVLAQVTADLRVLATDSGEKSGPGTL